MALLIVVNEERLDERGGDEVLMESVADTYAIVASTRSSMNLLVSLSAHEPKVLEVTMAAVEAAVSSLRVLPFR